MAERIWGCENDHGPSGPADAPLRHSRDRQRELAVEDPRLTRALSAPASRGLASGSRRGRRRSTYGVSFATAASASAPLTNQRGWVLFGRRSWVPFRRRLTPDST